MTATDMRTTPFYRKLKRLVLRQETEQGEGCGITDALANLRHLADELEQDFGKLDRSAYGHYISERAGEKD